MSKRRGKKRRLNSEDSDADDIQEIVFDTYTSAGLSGPSGTLPLLPIPTTQLPTRALLSVSSPERPSRQHSNTNRHTLYRAPLSNAPLVLPSIVAPPIVSRLTYAQDTVRADGRHRTVVTGIRPQPLSPPEPEPVLWTANDLTEESWEQVDTFGLHDEAPMFHYVEEPPVARKRGTAGVS